MTIDPETGGRIISFKLNDYEFLISRDTNPEAFGSTLWSSPQSFWNWPPPAVLDQEPYNSEIAKNSFKLTSGKDPVTGFQFIKEISVRNDNRLHLKYSIINTTNEMRKASPWEISRVNRGGLLFFPLGETPVRSKLFEPAKIDVIDSIVWYQDEKIKTKNHHLSIADGSEGWAAYAIERKLFIKKFEDVKPQNQAPGEAEILFYMDANGNFMEFEIQGIYDVIDPGAMTTWNVEWIAVEIPSDIKVEKGSKELVEFVRKAVN
jgi:hypothetical protein